MPRFLKMLKTVAIVCALATAAVAVITFGMFIGTVLLFFGAVAVVVLILLFLWKAFTAD